MKIGLQILIGAAVLAVSWTAQGDTLSLQRGEVLSGGLVDLSDGVVVFDTRLAGQVIVPISQVRSLTTDKAFDIQLQDGARLRGRFAGQGAETFVVAQNGGEATLLTLAAVKSIAPVRLAAFEETGGTQDAPSSLDLSWEGGYLYRWGNEDYDAGFTRLTLRNRAAAFDFQSEALLELSDDGRFPRLFRSYADWRFPSQAPFQPELGLELERDLDEALVFRGALNAGIGRTFINNPSRLLELTGGLNASFEYYDAEELWPDTDNALKRRVQALYYAGEGPREDEQDLNLRFRLRFRQFSRIGALSQTFSLYPSMTDLGELRARSESSLLMPVTAHLDFRLHLFVDYEDEPEFESMEKWRTSIGAGFQWDF